MFVLPMVGRSSRFTAAGYALPKYRLPLYGDTVFHGVLRSFESYFASDRFLFVLRQDHDSEEFVRSVAQSLGVLHAEVVTLSAETAGQADTVYQALQQVACDEELFIFNIDTLRPRFKKAPCSQVYDGYLEVFEGEGDHWSFVEPGPNDLVMRTTEKQRISRWCSDGLYHFRHSALFMHAFEQQLVSGELDAGELYVAPLYNHLIRTGCQIAFEPVEKANIRFCGTPAEYLQLLQGASA